MRKAERDQILSTMDQEQRQDFGRILQELNVEAKADAGAGSSLTSVLESRRSQFSTKILTKLDAVVQRDQMGPKVGETPPDFVLKKSGSEEQVKLSSFTKLSGSSGKRPVALVFGSYT